VQWVGRGLSPNTSVFVPQVRHAMWTYRVLTTSRGLRVIMVGLPLAMCDSVIAEEQDVSATALRGARRLLRAFARTPDENAIAALGASQGPALVRVRV